MMNQEPYATSTIAMTIYNMATRRGRPIEGPWDLAEQMRIQYHPEASDELIARAFDELVSRRLLVETVQGYRPIDTKNRVVVERDRSDVEVDESGEVFGGWKGWLLNDTIRGCVPMSEVI